MKKSVVLLSLFLSLSACATYDMSADDADDEVASTVARAITVAAPEEGEVADVVTIYGYDENGNPIYTPPEGSFAQYMEVENNDGDDLRVRCTQTIIYGCGTTTDGRLMTCSRCRCGKLCTGATEWCSEELCDF